MSDPTFDFALTLRCYRKRLGLDQAELAELLNVTQATISRWEAGIRAPRDPAGPDRAADHGADAPAESRCEIVLIWSERSFDRGEIHIAC